MNKISGWVWQATAAAHSRQTHCVQRRMHLDAEIVHTQPSVACGGVALGSNTRSSAPRGARNGPSLWVHERGKTSGVRWSTGDYTVGREKKALEIKTRVYSTSLIPASGRCRVKRTVWDVEWQRAARARRAAKNRNAFDISEITGYIHVTKG
ncbi:hypothetical protein B0H14DRAFT_2587044 [Mycena olivaceomarginata]|nr:hypothetical protein B0H14DRAFT_2587044 [Mycena olivaceomarginata]